MSYKPKFCCQCGEEIVRTDEKLWNSRRFCEFCNIEFGIHDWIPRLFLLCGILLGIIGVGSYWLKSDKPLNVVQNQTAVNVPNVNKNIVNQAVARQTENQIGQNIQKDQTNFQAQPGKPQNLQPAQSNFVRKNDNISAEAQEVVYYCGAQTKKGTMCSHRVKGGGRCWQHIGQPAMLPQEKLIVSQ